MSTDAQAKVFAVLDAMHISYQITHHPAVFTIEDMAGLGLAHMDKVAKNLFLRDDKKRNYYLVVVRNDKSVNLKDLRQQLGSRPLSFASEEDLHQYLGLTKGAVTPLGALNDTEHGVIVVIDKALAHDEMIGIHPNDNTATIWIAVNDLVTVLRTEKQEVIFLDI